MSSDLRKAIETELNGLKTNLGKFSTAVEIFDEAKTLSTAAQQELEKTTQESKKILDGSSESLKRLLEKQEELAKALDNSLNKLVSLQKKIADSNIPAELRDIKASITDLAENLNTHLKEIKNGHQHIQSGIKDGVQSISESIDDSTKKFKDGQQKQQSEIRKWFDLNHKDIKNEIKLIKEEFASDFNSLQHKTAIAHKALGASLLILILLLIVSLLL